MNDKFDGCTIKTMHTGSGNIIKNSKQKSMWERFCEWFGILGTTVTIVSLVVGTGLAVWIVGWQSSGWWFFWFPVPAPK